MTFVRWPILRENSILLGYNALSLGSLLSTFRRHYVPSKHRWSITQWRGVLSLKYGVFNHTTPNSWRPANSKGSISFISGARGGAVGWGTELQARSRGFCSRWCYWNFLFSKSFRQHYGPGVDSASNRNDHQDYFMGDKGGRCVGP